MRLHYRDSVVNSIISSAAPRQRDSVAALPLFAVQVKLQICTFSKHPVHIFSVLHVWWSSCISLSKCVGRRRLSGCPIEVQHRIEPVLAQMLSEKHCRQALHCAKFERHRLDSLLAVTFEKITGISVLQASLYTGSRSRAGRQEAINWHDFKHTATNNDFTPFSIGSTSTVLVSKVRD